MKLPFRSHSLATKLTYRIMAVVFVMLAVITGILNILVRHSMGQEAEERYQGVLLKTYGDLCRSLSDVSVATINSIHDIERDIDNPEAMYQHVERIVSQNPRITGCGLLFESDRYAGYGRYFAPYASQDSTGKVKVQQIGDIYNGYQEEEWFKKAMAKDSGDWTDPYMEYEGVIDTLGRQMLVTTYADFLHDRSGRKIGLVCSDMSLEDLCKSIEKSDKAVNEKYESVQLHKSYSFVIDRMGTYIVHPDAKRILVENYLYNAHLTPDTLDDRIVAQMIQGKTGSVHITVDGVRSWVYFHRVPHVEWSIAIVVPEEVIYHHGRELNTLILLLMFFCLGTVYFVSRRQILLTTRPLHSFAQSADKVALGNFDVALPDFKGNNEICQLHDAFENMRLSLSLYVDEQQKSAAKKASIERELRIAHGIQMAMVPNTFPQNDNMSIYASLTPALDVGGDLYDFLLRSNRLYFCIGDVSGKGVPAALLMAVVRTMFHSEATRVDSAADIVQALNVAVCTEQNVTGVFVTMFVGILDLTTGQLDYCNAAHELPVVVRGADNYFLLPVKPNLPIGAISDWRYEEQQEQLQRGDMLFLHTDGLNEAMNPDGILFGRQQVATLACQYGRETPRHFVDSMAEAVRQHTNTAEQYDDITLMAIRLEASKGLELPAEMQQMDHITDYVVGVAHNCGMSQKGMKQLRLAIEEAAANIVSYSQATTIRLTTAVADGQLLVSISDDGQPFDPTVAATADLSIPADERPPGGLGIVFLRQMTDGLDYQRTGDRNILTIRKTIC